MHRLRLEVSTKWILLTEKIDPEKMKMPSFKMILIGVGTYAYRREDGIYVVPIGCLKD